MGVDANTPQDRATDLTTALSEARPGSVIKLAPGKYSAVTDAVQRTGVVELRGSRHSTLSGLTLFGSSQLRVVNVRITGPVVIRQAANGAYTHDVTIDSSSVTGDAAETAGQPNFCILLRGGSEHVTLTNNRIRGCTYGLVAPPDAVPSQHIRIYDNIFEDLSGDAIQLARLRHAQITRNTLRRIGTKNSVFHNDGIQFLGGIQDMQIIGNRIFGSDDQLMLLQDALGEPNADVTVANNVMAGAGAVGVQSQGVERARFVNNTIFDARYGALLLRRGPRQLRAPRDTLVANNIFDGFAVIEEAGGTFRSNLVVGGRGTHRKRAALFRDPDNFDFRLRNGSRAIRRASPDFAPKVDINGVARAHRPSLGAYEPKAPRP